MRRGSFGEPIVLQPPIAALSLAMAMAIHASQRP